ncbi:hypothetical protein BD779DRAFT_1676277 [Infundibulicybe gibba]|nr:hypothetical protein BD779DRAFT_1676277 [Infundibulicybe gibba]
MTGGEDGCEFVEPNRSLESQPQKVPTFRDYSPEMSLPGLIPNEVVASSLTSSSVKIFTNIYFSAFSITSVVWDHAITFDDEIKYIWRGSESKLTKAAFAMNRYVVELLLIYVVYCSRGLTGGSISEIVQVKFFDLNLSVCLAEGEKSCRVFTYAFAILSALVITATQCFVSFRIYQLWECRKIVAQLLFVISIIFVLGTLITAAFSANASATRMSVIPGLLLCELSTGSPFVPTSLGTMAIFDLLLVLLMVFNVMDYPRRHNSDMIYMLHRDGALGFIVIFSA